VKLTPQHDQPWLEPGRFWPVLDSATAGLDPVFATISLQALSHNAFDMVRRSAGRNIRVASKSIRVRAILDAVLAVPGYHGVLAYTLAEALWLARSIDDVVAGYPSADRAGFAALAASEELAQRVTVMVDSTDQLDLIQAATAKSATGKAPAPIRVCLELDSSYRSRLLGHLGVYRSPVHSPAQAQALAAEIVRRPGFRLVGMMGYEAQIAGLGNAPAGKPLRAKAIQALQRASMAELTRRRGEAVRRVRELAELEFVNGGGTGSLEVTAADESVTELAAGSGLMGPHLFDTYAHFSPAPAAAFALPVVRRPAADRVTLLGGGWAASGAAGLDRLPQPVWPAGLKLTAREGAGEVQTPVTGAAARSLRIGDRVWFRHTKAGELSEHVNEFHVIDGDRITGSIATYRGEGKAFL
jgi:D-serine deaminase-like pyridoxal phosphate-dependent protein